MNGLVQLRNAAVGEPVAHGTSRPLTAEVLSAYAQASGDLNPLHLDSDVARKSGFDDVIVHGMLSMAQLGTMLADAFGQARITQFQARFVAVVPVGSCLHCVARLGERTTDSAWVMLEAMIADSDRVVLTGKALIDLRERGGA